MNSLDKLPILCESGSTCRPSSQRPHGHDLETISDTAVAFREVIHQMAKWPLIWLQPASSGGHHHVRRTLGDEFGVQILWSELLSNCCTSGSHPGLS